ncbi:hypothetical protein [Natrinema salsiterrestre]|uniref:Uncharacterized protein n=1 Tax=Natrinema salsiterrestre TaxID=2950540 RepID=A0A9Q4KY94_9EURY|nr:hypothetical protein [Natrinema salsiterrestre]MDF9744021.1 hypothetical protein [Natrinema salsiterrestre]
MSRGRGSPRSGTLTDAAGQLKAAFVLLVGLSGGLIAVQSDASLPVIAAAILGGIVAGGALLWYLIWITT